MFENRFDECINGEGSSGSPYTRTTACDNCHKKKIKCVGPFPCSQCKAADVACVIQRELRRRGPRSKEYVYSLEKRLKEAEDRLKHSPAKYEILEVTPNDSLDVLNDLSKLRMDLLTGYFEFCSPFLDIIPKTLIMRKISKMPVFYLNSLYCLSSWVMHKDQVASSMYYDECKKRLSDLMENSSIFNIIGLINLIMYSACINKNEARVFLSGLAMTLAKNMDNGGSPSINLSPLDDLHVRIIAEIKNRVWWYCYMAEVATTAAILKPAIYGQMELSCMLPSSDLIWNIGNSQLPQFDFLNPPQAFSTSLKDLLLYFKTTESHISYEIILHQIYLGLESFLCKVSSGEAHGNTEEFQIIENSLKLWFEYLPIHLKTITEYFTHKAVSNISNPHWVWAYLLIMYHALVIKLQRIRINEFSMDGFPSLSTIMHSTKNASRLCELFSERNPGFNHIFEIGISWYSISKDPFTENNMLCIKGIMLIMQSLDKCSNTFLQARGLSQRLQRIYLEMDGVTDTTQSFSKPPIMPESSIVVRAHSDQGLANLEKDTSGLKISSVLINSIQKGVELIL